MKSSHDNFRTGLFNSEYIKIGNALYVSIIYGLSQATLPITYFIWNMSMAERIEAGKSQSDQFTAFSAIIFGSFVLSNGMINSPNFAKGKRVASKILSVIINPKEGSKESSIVDGTQTLSKEQASQDIKFHNIWFKYPLENSKWVLRNFNFTIKGGQKVGLIGESGSGKSTIVQLLLRFYDPQEGFISIGGTNIKDFSLVSLRSMFGFIQQEPILLNTSIMNNIIYGKPDANAEEIMRAASMSNSHEFIWSLKNSSQELDQESIIEDDLRYSSLDDGYKISCGSKGSKLSGGQKQRIAIARALIRNPPILLLDEATSALDEKNQHKVQEALDNAAFQKTWIVIAHRTSTLNNWDNIYKIAEGAIIS